MNDIKRIDFEEGYADSDGNFIDGMNRKIAILYNRNIISYEEVCKLINSGEYEWDNRIVVTTSIRADNLKGNKR